MAFNQPLGNWKVGHVESIHRRFNEAVAMEQLPAWLV